MVIRSALSSHKIFLAALSVLLASLAGCSADPDTLVTVGQEGAANAPTLAAQQYLNSCAWCHGDGTGGAPVTGDEEDWERRTTKGMAKVYANAIDGFEGATGIMPVKGSRLDLSDEEIKNIVDYMVESSQ